MADVFISYKREDRHVAERLIWLDFVKGTKAVLRRYALKEVK